MYVRGVRSPSNLGALGTARPGRRRRASLLGFTSIAPGQRPITAWQDPGDVTAPPANPLAYVSPQSAIAAGLAPATVCAAWTQFVNSFATVQAAIAAGVPPGVVTQFWQGGPGSQPRRRKKFLGLGSLRPNQAVDRSIYAGGASRGVPAKRRSLGQDGTDLSPSVPDYTTQTLTPSDTIDYTYTPALYGNQQPLAQMVPSAPVYSPSDVVSPTNQPVGAQQVTLPAGTTPPAGATALLKNPNGTITYAVMQGGSSSLLSSIPSWAWFAGGGIVLLAALGGKR